MSFRTWKGCLDGRLEENLPFAYMRHPQTIRHRTIPHKNVKSSFFYDDMVINVGINEEVKQIGVFTYTTVNETQRTIPIVTLVRLKPQNESLELNSLSGIDAVVEGVLLLLEVCDVVCGISKGFYGDSFVFMTGKNKLGSFVLGFHQFWKVWEYA